MGVGVHWSGGLGEAWTVKGFAIGWGLGVMGLGNGRGRGGH